MLIVSYILNPVGLLDFWVYMFSSVTEIIIGYLLGYKLFFFTCFILDNNEITIERKALCRSEKTVYKQGELTEVKFSYSSLNNKKYVYKLDLILSNNKIINVFDSTYKIEFFTPQEINYFLYYVNKYIQEQMKSKN